jgi:hypothetical protein
MCRTKILILILIFRSEILGTVRDTFFFFSQYPFGSWKTWSLGEENIRDFWRCSW